MRKLLIVVGVILAVLVAAHYARWQWANPGTYAHHGDPAARASHGVCGTVASVYYDKQGKGQPTFVNLGHHYPNQTFTIVIWGKYRPRFNPPPESLQGKNICVTGRIKLYRGTPEIIAYGPDQIRFSK